MNSNVNTVGYVSVLISPNGGFTLGSEKQRVGHNLILTAPPQFWASPFPLSWRHMNCSFWTLKVSH